MKKLEDAGELDNTLILFMADNGGCAEVLGERRRGAARRDGDRDGLVAVDGREDERAEVWDVDDVAEERPRLGIAEEDRKSVV